MWPLLHSLTSSLSFTSFPPSIHLIKADPTSLLWDFWHVLKERRRLIHSSGTRCVPHLWMSSNNVRFISVNALTISAWSKSDSSLMMAVQAWRLNRRQARSYLVCQDEKTLDVSILLEALSAEHRNWLWPYIGTESANRTNVGRRLTKCRGMKSTSSWVTVMHQSPVLGCVQ